MPLEPVKVEFRSMTDLDTGVRTFLSGYGTNGKNTESEKCRMKTFFQKLYYLVKLNSAAYKKENDVFQ